MRFRNVAAQLIVQRFSYSMMRTIRPSPLTAKEACEYCHQCPRGHPLAVADEEGDDTEPGDEPENSDSSDDEEDAS